MSADRAYRDQQAERLAGVRCIRDAVDMNLLADSHIHLDDPRFDPDRRELIGAARRCGIRVQIVPSTQRLDWPRVESVIRPYPGMRAAYGLHPLFLSGHSPDDLPALEQWIQARPDQAVAVGEIGLDFHAADADRAGQQWYFQQQLRLAQRLQLPVIIHARKAMDEVIAQLRRHPDLRGVIHAFAGSEQQARQLLDLGFHLGIGGTVTYPRAQRLRRIVQSMPVERILLETDAPDQPVAGFQGQRNLPLRLLDVLHSVVELRCTTAEILSRQTLDNTCALFGLDRDRLLLASTDFTAN
ncbi:TatD family hydrolase [Frateuria aurantia]